jgi:hypothetical protein
VNRGLINYPGGNEHSRPDYLGRYSVRKLFFMPHNRLETLVLLLAILWLLGWLV